VVLPQCWPYFRFDEAIIGRSTIVGAVATAGTRKTRNSRGPANVIIIYSGTFERKTPDSEAHSIPKIQKTVKATMASAQLSEHEPHTELPKPVQQSPIAGPEEPKGSSARTWIVAIVVLAVVGAAVWKIRSNTQEQATQNTRLAGAADRAVPVMTAPVEKKTMPIYLTALGTVTAYNTVTIKTRVDGQLLQVNVREGQSVRKGQLLVEIDPKPYEAALAQAEGNLVRDQATSANADAQAARYTALLNAGVVSKESQQGLVSSAGQAQGAIAGDQAAIQAAKVNLGYTKIYSPIDGVVGLRQVDPGNIVHAADTTGLLVVTQLQPIAVIFTLPEDQLPQVQAVMKRGGTLAVEAYDRSNTTHLASGKLLTLDNQIDTTTGTVKAKAVFDNKDSALFPNQFVNVRLVLQDRENALVIPSAALQTGSQGSFVFVVKQGQPPVDPDAANSGAAAPVARPRQAPGAGTGGDAAGPGANVPPAYVEARQVKVDLTEGTQVIMLSGVNAGEQVVVDGQEKLKNNARVIPRDANAPTGTGGGRGSRSGAQGSGAPGKKGGPRP
jgi:membrane fusion protein, multidrug efflux system